ncbi:MAG: polyprenyl synthetase family protein [Candidatus Nanopelagicaceae bacterium]|nr:polyprenyl synthetase family protein [Candidatus Nanopelagicaceae bacterium]
MATLPDLAPEIEQDLTRRLDLVEKLLFAHVEGKYPFVNETSRHLIVAGGKRLRPVLTLLAANYGNSGERQVIEAAVVCELTHLATLYHDDVMDEAPLRRGVESANELWGNAIAILTGDYLFAKASDLLADLGPEAVRLQARTFERLVIGQIRETQGPQNGADPLEHYISVIADKTGSLFGTSIRFGALLSGTSPQIVEALTIFGEEIGLAFQLADDVIDIASQTNESGKTPGTDLREGVPTLVTLLVQKANRPEDQKLIASLAGPISDENEVAKVLNALRVHPALEEARTIAMQYAENSRKLLSVLPVNETTSAFLTLCDSLVTRSS